MSQIHVTRIEQKILETYGELIDMHDYATKPEPERNDALRSRAVAACAIYACTNASPQDCADSITDSYFDMGIDAVYNDNEAKELYFIQSKWIADGNGSPARGDILKYISGVRRALAVNFEEASEKLKKKIPIIEHALMDSDYRLKFVVAYTGAQKLSDEVQRDIDDFIHDLNDTSDVIECITVNQKLLYDSISGGADASPINIDDIDLRDWGKIDSPYLTYYGHVNASVITTWWERYGNRLFAKNIRYYKGSSETNEGIVKTLIDTPKDFWYFNNGIKVLCDSFAKKPIYGDDHSVGLFTAHGISIVNGAQTVGCIGTVGKTSPTSLNDAQVMVQFISLDNAPEGYDVQVTKLSNTQNKIDGKDFVALDPQQDRIRRDLWMDGITYLYKGSLSPKKEKEISLEEATIALACYNADIKYSTLTKRNVGAFYESMDKAPYTDIFNDRTNVILLYNTVLESRYLEKILEQKRKTASGKRKQILVHGNRLILHCVLLHQTLHYKLIYPQSTKDLEEGVEEYLDVIIESAEAGIMKLFPDNYVNSLFKNNAKCAALKSHISANIKSASYDLPGIESIIAN